MKSVYIPSGLAKVHPGLESAFKSIQGVLDEQSSVVTNGTSSTTSLAGQIANLKTLIQQIQAEIVIIEGELAPLIHTYTAANAVYLHAAVYESDYGSVDLADSSAVITSATLLGISLSTASPGALVNVAEAGSTVQDLSWNWTQWQPVFVGTAGALTQTPPLLPVVVGVAVSPTSILVSPETPFNTLNTSVSAIPTQQNVVYRWIGQDGNPALTVLDSFGAAGAALFRTAAGMAALPTAVQQGYLLGSLGLIAYGATDYSSEYAFVSAYAAENWTDIANGYGVITTTVKSGTITPLVQGCVTDQGYHGIGQGFTEPLSRLDVQGSVGGKVVESSAVALMLDDALNYIYTGLTAAVWAVPLLSTVANRHYLVKNTGAGVLQLNTSSSLYETDSFYDSSPVSSFSLSPGQSVLIAAGESYWYLFFFAP